jgi:hypothetical protein
MGQPGGALPPGQQFRVWRLGQNQLDSGIPPLRITDLGLEHGASAGTPEVLP